MGGPPSVRMRTPPPPPEPPPDHEPAPPDFVGVGAQRCATSWWYSLLAAHPDFHRAADAPKELHFFDRCLDEGFVDADVDLYARPFARPPGTISGEWTPRYMFDYWTPRFLKACAPEARLLVILRDPVERYRSGMAAHIASMRDRGRASHPMAPGVRLARSRYWSQLDGLLRHFDREQILLMQYERCVAEPSAQLARTHDFVGLTPAPPDTASLGSPVNASEPDAAPALSSEVESELRDALRDNVRRLAVDFPEIDLGLWPSTADALS